MKQRFTSIFDFHSSHEGYDHAPFGGLTARLIYDLDAPNSFEEWDAMTPCAWHAANKVKGTEELLRPLDWYSSAQISRHHKKICKLIGYELREHEADVKELHSHQAHKGDTRKEAFDSFIEATQWHGLSYSDLTNWLGTCAQLFNLIGIDATTHRRAGCSQGDCVTALLVNTPEHVEDTGMAKTYAHKHHERHHSNAMDLLAAWLWGDVYIIAVEDAKGETLELRGGYYGDEHALGALSALFDDCLAQRVKYVCNLCGSDKVTRDALASWNSDAQEWELAKELDNADCRDCGEEIHPKEVKLWNL